MTIACPRIGSLLLALTLSVLGCKETPGEGQIGDHCDKDGDCASLLCVGGVAGDDTVCTQSCGGNEECPEDWSCGAVTQAGVVVCRQGASTPFGQ